MKTRQMSGTEEMKRSLGNRHAGASVAGHKLNGVTLNDVHVKPGDSVAVEDKKFENISHLSVAPRSVVIVVPG